MNIISQRTVRLTGLALLVALVGACGGTQGTPNPTIGPGPTSSASPITAASPTPPAVGSSISPQSAPPTTTTPPASTSTRPDYGVARSGPPLLDIAGYIDAATISQPNICGAPYLPDESDIAIISCENIVADASSANPVFATLSLLYEKAGSIFTGGEFSYANVDTETAATTLARPIATRIYANIINRLMPEDQRQAALDFVLANVAKPDASATFGNIIIYLNRGIPAEALTDHSAEMTISIATGSQTVPTSSPATP